MSTSSEYSMRHSTDLKLPALIPVSSNFKKSTEHFFDVNGRSMIVAAAAMID